ncbi:MAG: glycoside hydrolase family protein [Pseudomonadota bacterium]
MALNMRTSQAGLDVIKAFEGFRASSELLPNGRWIIGYGHLRRAKERKQLSEIEAEAILREYDLPPVERFVMRCVLAPMTQNEFDALVSLAFNIGPSAFSSSDVVAALNGGQRLDAAHAFDHWRRAKIGGRVQIVDALVRRRAAEKALFLNAPGRLPVASSRLYRAMHDSEVLPAPVKPREILVEHVPPPAETPDTPDERPKQTATEAAAESVRQQMVRILGESAPETPPNQTDGATPEEITAAISELAGQKDEARVQKSVWPQHDDLPPPPNLDEEPDLDPPEGEILAQIGDTAVIDDLAEVEVSPESIEEAVKVNRAIEAESQQGTFFAALPYGVLALIGAVLGGYGLFGFIAPDETVETPLAIYLPAFLSVLGILLFLVMAYYFIRALRSGD